MPGGRYLTAFVQVANHGERDAERRLALYVDGELSHAYDIMIPAKGQRAVVTEDVPPDTETVEARLLGVDILALDDQAWAVYRGRNRAEVVLISEGNRFLETALRLMPTLQVSALRPEGNGLTGVEPSALNEVDLTVLDGDVPVAATPPSGSLLYIAPPRSSVHFSVTGRVDSPIPRVADPTDPLVAHIGLREVGVLEASRVALPSWARAVLVGDVDGETVPLLFIGQIGGRRIAVLTFDLRRSDLPLQVAFPLLFANLTDWLLPAQGTGIPEQVRPGAPVALAVPPQVEAVSLRKPSGDTVRLAPSGGRAVFADTNELGVYELSWGEERARFVVSLLSARESDVLPAAELAVGSGETESRGELSMRARREWWRTVAYGGLVLLVVEWAVYQRSVVVRMAVWVWSWVRRLAQPRA
jgi:hypothetical protein